MRFAKKLSLLVASCTTLGAACLALATSPLVAGLALSTKPPEAAVPVRLSTSSGPLRLGIVGLVHGHVEGLLWQASQREDMVIVGIAEPNRALFDRLAAKYKLSVTLYHPTLEGMLAATNPEAVSVMSTTAAHRAVAELCAPRGVHMLVEKPLAFTTEDAQHISALSARHGVLVLTNFETSWYNSVRHAKQLVASGEMAPIRRMDFRHGHKGPIEIGCAPEFTDWLTDPVANGGGAITDFGCYGAVIATWLMNGQRPISVTAATATLKPKLYPKVDDDATIVLTYPTATAVIGASWAWTHDNKEMDIYTERGSIHAGRGDELSSRSENAKPISIKPAGRPPELANEWTYLRAVVRGKCAVDPLSSLEFNVIVAEILDAARQSAAAAKPLAPLTPVRAPAAAPAPAPVR